MSKRYAVGLLFTEINGILLNNNNKFISALKETIDFNIVSSLNRILLDKHDISIGNTPVIKVMNILDDDSNEIVIFKITINHSDIVNTGKNYHIVPLQNILGNINDTLTAQQKLIIRIALTNNIKIKEATINDIQQLLL